REHAPAKRNRASLRIHDRKDHAPTKPIIKSAAIFFNDQTAPLNLRRRRAFALQVRTQPIPTIRRETKTKNFARLFTDASALNIFTRCLRLAAALGQLLLPPFERPTVQLDNFVRLTSPRLKAFVLLHHGQRHVHLLRDNPDGFGKRHALDLHHEVKYAPALAAVMDYSHLGRKRVAITYSDVNNSS